MSEPATPPCDVAVFGGTFDPPHEGHASVLRYLLSDLGIRLVVLAPTAQNPFKERRPSPLPFRIEMLRLLCEAEGFPLSSTMNGNGVYVSTFEYIYARDFVLHWRSMNEAPIGWVISKDLIGDVKRWKNWEELEIPMIVAPELQGVRSTMIRENRHAPHPALKKFIEINDLYS